jgi:beta-galactosidase
LLDRTGEVRPLAGERQSWWSAAPMVRVVRRVAPADLMPTDPGYGTEEKHTEVLFADWTPTNSAPHDENVEAYSNCQEVELFLNGKSLGAKPLPADAAPRVWNVAYAPGTLKAVAKNNGKIFATDELRTAGKPAKIILRPDRKTLANDWDDVARVTATVADENSVAVPGADGLIAFRISGPGVIAAVDNGGNASHEPFQAGERRAIQGRCVAFVKATAASGKSILTATAPGLTAGSAVFKISRLASTE